MSSFNVPLASVSTGVTKMTNTTKSVRVEFVISAKTDFEAIEHRSIVKLKNVPEFKAGAWQHCKP